MKSSTTKEHLLYGISLTERIAGKKESLPILSCVLLEADGKQLILRATNLEAGIEVVIPARNESGGVVAVPAHILSQTIHSLSGDTIILKEQENNLSIESRGSKNLIKAIPHEEFPSLTVKTKPHKFSTSRIHILSTLQAVLYAASPSMIRPELGSVYLSFNNGAVCAVATDSFRLAEKKTAGMDKKASGELLIPLKHANELVYVLERMMGDEVEITADDAQCVVEGGGVCFTARLVEGQFPNYQEIIPKKFTTEATVLKSDITEILRKARIFSGQDQQIGVHVYPKRKVFSATARSPEIGEMSDSVDAAVSGEDLDINFHIGYLADCMPSIGADSVILGFAGAGKPLVIRGASDNSFMYLVMPLNR